MYNHGNIAFFLGKTSFVNAKIDSIKPVRGMAGRGWNQKIYFHFTYEGEIYLSSFKNTAIKWSIPLKMNDSLKVKILNRNPNTNKIVSVYYAYR